MSVDRPNETELELVERRGREADERARISDAAMKPCRDPSGVAGAMSAQDIANRGSDGRF